MSPRIKKGDKVVIRGWYDNQIGVPIAKNNWYTGSPATQYTVVTHDNVVMCQLYPQPSYDGSMIGSVDWISEHWLEVTVTAPAFYTPPKPSCTHCNRELSAYLDAYWGDDIAMGKLCSDCRYKHQRNKI